MSDFLCITVRWLDVRYHGRTDEGSEAEWPPSPLRLFQAIIAGTKRSQWNESLSNALRWLEGISERTSPTIVGPDARAGSPYTLFVPNNDTDKPADVQRAAKIVRPTILPTDAIVHYLWSVEPADRGYAERVARAAKHLTALGWGIDLAIADGEVIDAVAAGNLAGLRWKPLPPGIYTGQSIRVPVAGTLLRLEQVHESFLNRLADGISRPPLPFTTYQTIQYVRSDDPPARHVQVFELQYADELSDEERDAERNTGKRRKPYSYNPARLMHVAAWVRHAAIELTRTNPRLRDLAEFVSGHGDRTSSDYRQLSYLPLSSIGHVHTDPGIRRVIIAEPAGSTGETLRRLSPFLNNMRLKPETSDTPAPRLKWDRPDKNHEYDGVVKTYLERSQTWASVTPVILPGHDDHKPAKTRKLIEKSLIQSGIDQPCEFEWSAISHFHKSLPAFKYDRQKRLIGYLRPDHLLHQTAVHLRLQFSKKLAGPCVVGSGRHIGLGIFAHVRTP
jgi:CRISPR-associated protein Csb2